MIHRRVYLQNLPSDVSSAYVSNMILNTSGHRVEVIKKKGQTYALLFCDQKSEVLQLIDKLDGLTLEGKQLQASKRLQKKEM